MSFDKQTAALSVSAPGMAARFQRAASEGCIWRVAISDVPPIEWTEEMIGGRIAIRQTVGLSANSFQSKTAALRASWSNLEAVYGKGGFSEKGSWGFPSFQLELVVEGKKVSRKCWQSVLPFFGDKPKASPVTEAAEAAKPSAKPSTKPSAAAEKVDGLIIPVNGGKAPKSFAEAAAPATEEPVKAPELPVEAPAIVKPANSKPPRRNR